MGRHAKRTTKLERDVAKSLARPGMGAAWTLAGKIGEVQDTDIGAEGEAAWEQLLAVSVATMGELEESGLEKSRAIAANRLSKMGLSKPPFDCGKIKRFMVEYARTLRFRKSAERAGVTVREAMDVKVFWPEVGWVYEYIRRIRKARAEAENEELVDTAREGLMRKMEDEDCRLDTKALTFVAERLDRESFGEDAAKAAGGGRGDRPQVTYNIPSLTLNWINVPGANGANGGAAIDIGVANGEAVEAEVVGSLSAPSNAGVDAGTLASVEVAGGVAKMIEASAAEAERDIEARR